MSQLLYLLLLSFILIGDQFQGQDPPKGKILFVVSNADHYGESDISTSNHFAELVYPYDVLAEAGYDIDFVSPKGGAVPLGYFDTSETLMKEYLYDCHFMAKLKETLSPNLVNPNEYVAIYYGGGGAAMFGVAENEEIQKIAIQIYEQQGGIISAVCHGSIGIANLKTRDGKYLVAGKSINGFPDLFENKARAYFAEFEHSVEALLKLRGAKFQYSEEGWDGYYQVDGRIITGQDPSSATKVAELIIKQLNTKNKS